MEMYKFIDEKNVKQYGGGFIVLEGRIYTNPREETLKAAGYKPLVKAEVPEYDTAKQFIVKKYIDNEDSIAEEYEVNDFPEVKDYETV